MEFVVPTLKNKCSNLLFITLPFYFSLLYHKRGRLRQRGASSVIVKDKKMLYRLELLDKISDDDHNTILKVVDSYLKEAQTNSTRSKLK